MRQTKKSTPARRMAVEIISALLVLLFVYAAISKLIDHKQFAHTLGKVSLLAPVAIAISWLVPVAELIISGLLLGKRTRLAGLAASLSLLLLFTAYLSFTLALGTNIPCSCGGILQGMKWGPHIAFNMVFVLLAFIAINLELKNSHIQHEQTLEATF
ncbi:MAG: hypothetical protein JST19_17390 [Bacteroidetes bacterium]|nr:hypothetical protein [Bacteroidota bacterium]